MGSQEMTGGRSMLFFVETYQWRMTEGAAVMNVGTGLTIGHC